MGFVGFGFGFFPKAVSAEVKSKSALNDFLFVCFGSIKCLYH